MENILKWKNGDVLNYLRANKMETLCDIFAQHTVSGKDLLLLSAEDLRSDLHISNLHIRKKLQRHIERLQRAYAESSGNSLSRELIECIVKVMYFSKEALFRVFNPSTYTIQNLLEDCIQCYQLHSVFCCTNEFRKMLSCSRILASILYPCPQLFPVCFAVVRRCWNSI